MALLELRGVHKRFGGVHAVRGVDLAVEEGQVTGLIGPNGAGKTTLFSLVAGALRPDEGSIALRGERVDGLAPHELVARGLVRTFQVPREFARMGVRENLMLAAPGQTGEHLRGLLGAPRRAKEAERRVRAKAEEWLAFLGLERLADGPASDLSGGQKKLLELGRALMTEPRLVLLDEPMAGVNPTLAAELMDRVAALRARGLTFFLIEHDMPTLMAHCDRVIALHEGRIVADGEPAAVQRHPEVLASYLGA